jgi:hypothetical protein
LYCGKIESRLIELFLEALILGFELLAFAAEKSQLSVLLIDFASQLLALLSIRLDVALQLGIVLVLCSIECLQVLDL